jgi:cyclopropane-fatty-acyl-phospholipid synthase
MSYQGLVFKDRMPTKRELHAFDQWLLRKLLQSIGPSPLRLVIRERGEISPPGGSSPVATVVINDLPTLARLIVDPEMEFGDAYADGRIEVEGDLVGALEAVYRAWPSGRADTSWYQRLTSKAMTWFQDNSPGGSRNNIHAHYDLGNDFYKLWLDSRLVYTCAYYESPSMTLEEAQIAKLDYVSRKLQLRPGETVIEAGCGWGALALHMAERYGVSVKAFNISREQIAYAQGEAARRGLSGRVEFIEDDYRNISGSSDVFVSVGMLEHVGVNHFKELGDVIYRCIGERGRGLIHYIGKSYKADFSRWIRRRIFPGASAPALGDVMSIFEPHRYAVVDVENLRPHYARTAEHWLQRFDQSSRQVREQYDAWFERAWRLYLAGSIAAFRTGTLQLFQITFAGSQCPQTSWTRHHLYCTAKEDR